MITIYDSGSYWTPNGYYALIGDVFVGPYCPECWKRDDVATPDYETVTWDHETDTPVHCDLCRALLVTSLTRDGVEYVRDAIAENTGDADVLAVWGMAFAQEIGAVE